MDGEPCVAVAGALWKRLEEMEQMSENSRAAAGEMAGPRARAASSGS